MSRLVEPGEAQDEALARRGPDRRRGSARGAGQPEHRPVGRAGRRRHAATDLEGAIGRAAHLGGRDRRAASPSPRSARPAGRAADARRRRGTVASDGAHRSERRAPTQREVEGASRRDHRHVGTGVRATRLPRHRHRASCATVNGLGKGAFYHYIESKEELLAAIHDRVMDEVMLGADRVAEAGGSPSAQLAMLGDELLDVIHRYPDHVWVFLHEFPALTDGARRAVPRAPARVRAAGRGGPAGRHRLRGVPRRRPAAHRARVARHAQLHVPVAQAGRPRCRRATWRSRSPTSSSAGSRRRELQTAHRRLEAEEAAEGAADQRGPLVGGEVAELLRRSAPGCRGTCLPRAGSRCPTRSSTTPVMCRHATATGSSWNDTWNWRCTYSLGVSGYGHFSFRRNSCAMLGWSFVGAGVVPVPEPPVGVLADAGDPALVHAARPATRASAR